jgi:uncharacterized DUF497 family protein
MDITYRLQGLSFEWDQQKALSNIEKHGITFEEAAEVFLDPFGRGGDASAGGEDRALPVGYSFSHHLLLVVHSERSAGTRIISARTATRVERKLYERP